MSKGAGPAAIDSIMKEGAEILKEYKGSAALDAGLLAAAQAVERYEITRYGTLRAGRRASLPGRPFLPSVPRPQARCGRLTCSLPFAV